MPRKLVTTLNYFATQGWIKLLVGPMPKTFGGPFFLYAIVRPTGGGFWRGCCAPSAEIFAFLISK